MACIVKTCTAAAVAIVPSKRGDLPLCAEHLALLEQRRAAYVPPKKPTGKRSRRSRRRSAALVSRPIMFDSPHALPLPEALKKFSAFTRAGREIRQRLADEGRFVCGHCGEVKDASEFRLRRHRAADAGIARRRLDYQSYDRTCQRIVNNALRRAQRQRKKETQ